MLREFLIFENCILCLYTVVQRTRIDKLADEWQQCIKVKVVVGLGETEWGENKSCT